MIDYKKAWLDSEQIIHFLEEKINIEIKQHDKSREEFSKEIQSQSDFYEKKLSYMKNEIDNLRKINRYGTTQKRHNS